MVFWNLHFKDGVLGRPATEFWSPGGPQLCTRRVLSSFHPNPAILRKCGEVPDLWRLLQRRKDPGLGSRHRHTIVQIPALPQKRLCALGRTLGVSPHLKLEGDREDEMGRSMWSVLSQRRQQGLPLGDWALRFHQLSYGLPEQCVRSLRHVPAPCSIAKLLWALFRTSGAAPVPGT